MGPRVIFFLIPLVIVWIIVVEANQHPQYTWPQANPGSSSNVRTFLRDELSNTLDVVPSNFVVSGGTASTSANLTHTISAMEAYVNGHYVKQAAAVRTYTANRRTYVYLSDRDNGTPTVAGGLSCGLQPNGERALLFFVECTPGSGEPTVGGPTFVRILVVDTDAIAITGVKSLITRTSDAARVHADDYPSVQVAIDAATENGTRVGIVVFGARSYIFNKTINVYPGTVLLGAGGAGRSFDADNIQQGTELRYIGSGAALSLDSTGVDGPEAMDVLIRDLSVRSASGTVGILINRAANVNIVSVRVEGRLRSGVVRTGFSMACIRITGMFPNIPSIVIHISNSYMHSCVGDGILSDTVNNNNAISIHQNRIIQNGGIGINSTSTGKGWSIVGNDIEGNSSGQIFASGPQGWTVIGNYFEHVGTADSIIRINGGRGVQLQGNFLQGNNNANGIVLGTTISVEGFLIANNDIVAVANAVNCGVPCINSVLGPNVTGTAEAIVGRGSGTTKVFPGASLISTFHHDYTATAAENTANETTVRTIAIPPCALCAGSRGVRLKLLGNYINTTGADRTLTVRVKYGDVVVAVIPFSEIPTTGQSRTWWAEVELFGDLNNNMSIGGVLLGYMGAAGLFATTAAVPFSTVTNYYMALSVPDTSQSNTLTVTVQHDIASSGTHVSLGRSIAWLSPS